MSTSLNDAKLWEWQRDYFAKTPIEAWFNEVPSYVTSNPFIARAYAQMAFALMQEHPEKSFTILELGTGTGQFSYYVLRHLDELISEHPLDIKWRYIVSDFTPHLLSYWQDHPQLKPYIKRGILHCEEIHLERDDLLQLKVDGPLITFCNYLFDAIAQNAYQVTPEGINELHVDITTDDNNWHEETPLILEKLEITYTPKPYNIDEARLSDASKKVLKHYQSTLLNTHFLLPLGAFNVIEQLKKTSQQQLLLIATDKGYSDISELEELEPPELTYHGCFSMMVNFDAIARFVEYGGDKAYRPSLRPDIKSAVYCSKALNSTSTKAAFNEHFEQFNPSDYFRLYKHVTQNQEQFDLNTLLSYCALSRWDAFMFSRVRPRICELLTEVESTALDYLLQHLPLVAENFYFQPQAPDAYFDVAICYHTLYRYADAIHYYQKSITYFGDQFSTLFNSAVCYYQQNDHDNALANFKKAAELNPDSTEAQQWLQRLSD